MKTICVHCKTSFEIGDEFAGQSVACVSCGEAVIAEPVKICKHCNMEIPASATKCMHCEKSLVSIGIRQPGKISSGATEEKVTEQPKADRPKIGILKPGERSTLPHEPVAEPVAIPEEIPLKEPGVPMNHTAPAAQVPVATREEPPAAPQKISLKMPGSATAPAPAAAAAAENGNVPKITLKKPENTTAPEAAPASTPSVGGGAPKLNLPGKAPSAGGGAPKLNLPGKAPSAGGGAPKLNLPGKAPSAGGGAPKLNLPGKAPSPGVVAPKVSAPAPSPGVVAPKVSAPAPSPAVVAPKVSAPAPSPAVVTPSEEVAVETSVFAQMETPVPKKADWAQRIAIIIFVIACLIILGVIGIFTYWFITDSSTAEAAPKTEQAQPQK